MATAATVTTAHRTHFQDDGDVLMLHGKGRGVWHKAHLPRGCIPHFEMCFELSLVGPQTAERESTLFPNTSLWPLAEAYHSTVETSHAQHHICPACPPPNPSHPLPQMVVTFRAPQQIWREEGKGGGGEAKENNIQRILKFLFLPSFSVSLPVLLYLRI